MKEVKTVVQQIIEKFEHIQKNDCKTLPEVIFFDGAIAILQTEFLDAEKTQNENYYKNGFKDGYSEANITPTPNK